MKVGDLRGILSHVDDDADVAITMKVKETYPNGDVWIYESTTEMPNRCTCMVSEVEYNRSRELLELHSKDADEAIERFEKEIDALEREANGMGEEDGGCHCCTECGHWSPMDGKCSVNGELYHGWETACDRFVRERDTR